MLEELPINAAAKNVVWVYDHLVAPRFPNAPAIIETTRSHRMPDFEGVPEGSDISAELYGRASQLMNSTSATAPAATRTRRPAGALST